VRILGKSTIDLRKSFGDVSHVSIFWAQPVDGSAGRMITNFQSEHIMDFHWSTDGSQLGVVRGHTDSDVVLIGDVEH
jgi:hypothetical protein